MTAGAAPPATVIAGMEAMGIAVTHVYGPHRNPWPLAVCEPQRRWQGRMPPPLPSWAARQGGLPQGEMRVINPVSGEPVPMGWQDPGRERWGNIVMKGYLKNPAASEEEMAQGWFRRGSAVWHPDGYVEIKDRSKGHHHLRRGRNISSLGGGGCAHRHPDVEEAAVIAMPDETWEVPCASSSLLRRELPRPSSLRSAASRWPTSRPPSASSSPCCPRPPTGKVQKFMLQAAGVEREVTVM